MGSPQQGKPGHRAHLEAVPAATAATSAARPKRASAAGHAPSRPSAKARGPRAIGAIEPVASQRPGPFEPVLSILALHLGQREHRGAQQGAQLLTRGIRVGQARFFVPSQRLGGGGLPGFPTSFWLFRSRHNLVGRISLGQSCLAWTRSVLRARSRRDDQQRRNAKNHAVNADHCVSPAWFDGDAGCSQVLQSSLHTIRRMASGVSSHRLVKDSLRQPTSWRHPKPRTPGGQRQEGRPPKEAAL